MLDDEISRAILLLRDENLVWSSDFELIRRNLAGLLAKALQTEYHYLEPEIGDLALNLVREREPIVRELDTTEEANTLRRPRLTLEARAERPGKPCCGSCESRLDA